MSSLHREWLALAGQIRAMAAEGELLAGITAESDDLEARLDQTLDSEAQLLEQIIDVPANSAEEVLAKLTIAACDFQAAPGGELEARERLVISACQDLERLLSARAASSRPACSCWSD